MSQQIATAPTAAGDTLTAEVMRLVEEGVKRFKLNRRRALIIELSDLDEDLNMPHKCKNCKAQDSKRR